MKFPLFVSRYDLDVCEIRYGEMKTAKAVLKFRSFCIKDFLFFFLFRAIKQIRKVSDFSIEKKAF